MKQLKGIVAMVVCAPLLSLGCIASDGTIGEGASGDEQTETDREGEVTGGFISPAAAGKPLTVCQSYRSASWSHGTVNQGWPLDIGLSSYCPGNEAANVPLVAMADGTVAHLRRTPASMADDHMYLRVAGGGLAMYGHVVPTSAMYEGKPVKKGEVIATIRPASWSNNYQAHLHLEIYAGNCWMCSPQPFSGAFRMGSNNPDLPANTTSDYYRGRVFKAPTTTTTTTASGATFRKALTIQGKCADMAGTNTGAGNLAKAQIYTCSAAPGTAAQHFSIDGSRRLVNGNGRCLDVYGSSTADGADLINYDCHTGNNQKWTFAGMELVNRNSGSCIDVPGGNFVDGQDLQQYTCNDTAAQKWTFDPATRELKIAGKCLDLTSSNTADGTRLQVWTCNGSSAQKWNPGRGGFTSALHSGKCIDVASSSTANGAPIQLWTCNDSNAQKFALRGAIRNVNSGKCVDLTGGSLTNGNQLQQFACVAGHQNQEFTLWMP